MKYLSAALATTLGFLAARGTSGRPLAAIWLRILVAIPMLAWGAPAAWMASGTGVLDFRSPTSALPDVPLPIAGALIVSAVWLLVGIRRRDERPNSKQEGDADDERE